MKKVIFIGNSFLYYGNCVERSGDRLSDKGYFYQLCRAGGQEVTVTNATYGGHHLYDFLTRGCASPVLHQNGPASGCGGVGTDLLGGLDLSGYDLVVMAESGDWFDDTAAHGSTVENACLIRKRFLDAGCRGRFVYCVHTYPYTKNVPYAAGAVAQLWELKRRGFLVVNWGEVIERVLALGRLTDSGVRYDRNTFIVRRTAKDGYHPNLLTGYLSALMIYATVTGCRALGQDYRFCENGFEEYVRTCYGYEGAETNFPEIFHSDEEMRKIQEECDIIITKYQG